MLIETVTLYDNFLAKLDTSYKTLIFFYYSLFLIFKIFYLSFFRERGKGGKKRGRETLMWKRTIHLSLECPQPGHVPWLGIDLVTFRFAGWCSTHWATPVRTLHFLKVLTFVHKCLVVWYIIFCNWFLGVYILGHRIWKKF